MRALVWISALAATAHAGVWQAKDNPAITEGEVTLEGEPAAIYAQSADFTKWNQIFPDVAKVEIKSHKGDDAKVTLISPHDHRDNLSVHLTPPARMIQFEDTGNAHAEVWGEIVFIAGDAPHTTKVHIRLFADTKGVASLVVNSDDVRTQREQKLSRQLDHIEKYWARTARR
ncbi:MAG: hypothetical protein QM831_38900 [Kofleriaceae bacterium]